MESFDPHAPKDFSHTADGKDPAERFGTPFEQKTILTVSSETRGFNEIARSAELVTTNSYWFDMTSIIVLTTHFKWVESPGRWFSISVLYDRRQTDGRPI